MTTTEKLATKLVNYRRRCELSQQELADELDLSRGFISDLERGVKTVSVDVLARICQRTGIKSAAVLGA